MKKLVLAFALVTSVAYGVETSLFSLSKEVNELMNDKNFNKALAGKGHQELLQFIETIKENSKAPENFSFTIDEQSKIVLISSFFELLEKNLLWALSAKFGLEQELNNVLQLRLLSSLDPKNEASKLRVQQEELLFAQAMEKRGSAVSEKEIDNLMKTAITELCDLFIKKLNNTK